MEDKVVIELNKKWRLVSDKYCWTLQRKYKKGNRIYYTSNGYYAHIEDAIEAILEKELRESEVKSLRALLGRVNEIKVEIREALKNAKKVKK